MENKGRPGRNGEGRRQEGRGKTILKAKHSRAIIIQI